MRQNQYSGRTSGPGEELHRCFFAIQPGQEVVAYLGSLIENLKRHRANVRWVPVANIHLTLRFLGEIDDRTLERLRRLPSEGQIGQAFTIGASGLGAFPQMRAPSIVWAGVDGEAMHDLDRLRHLQARTERWAREAGIAPERKRFTPHLTLGRVRRPPDRVSALIDDITVRECRSPFRRVAELLLMRSTLTPSGSEYEVLERWKLDEGIG